MEIKHVKIQPIWCYMDDGTSEVVDTILEPSLILCSSSGKLIMDCFGPVVREYDTPREAADITLEYQIMLGKKAAKVVRGQFYKSLDTSI